MATGETTHVKQVQLSQAQLTAAMQRATANASTWAVWKDPKAPAQGTSNNK